MKETKYVQITVPDAMRLAEMLIKAKGANRTMADLSEECGINTSTLSRIVNGKIKRPLTIDVLHKIYEHRDYEAGFSFEELLLANGTASEEERGRKGVADRMLAWDEKKKEYENFKRHSKNAIMNAMVDRNIVVQSIPQDFERRSLDSPFGIELPFDFNFYLEKAKKPLWYIKVMPPLDFVHAIRRNFNIASCFFVVDAWQPEFFAGSVTTFVFSDETAMASFVGVFANAPIKTSMSAMLVDANSEQVLKEEWISNNGGLQGLLEHEVTGSKGVINTWVDEEDEYEYIDDDDEDDDE